MKVLLLKISITNSYSKKNGSKWYWVDIETITDATHTFDIEQSTHKSNDDDVELRFEHNGRVVSYWISRNAAQ